MPLQFELRLGRQHFLLWMEVFLLRLFVRVYSESLWCRTGSKLKYHPNKLSCRLDSPIVLNHKFFFLLFKHGFVAKAACNGVGTSHQTSDI